MIDPVIMQAFDIEVERRSATRSRLIEKVLGLWVIKENETRRREKERKDKYLKHEVEGEFKKLQAEYEQLILERNLIEKGEHLQPVSGKKLIGKE